MGTRSTTKIYDGQGRPVLAIYKQYDGYPKGWGKDLEKFIRSGKFVNGISEKKGKIQFNGIGDFALQLITHFKTEAGGIYATHGHDRQEYNYILTFKPAKNKRETDKIIIKCEPEYAKEDAYEKTIDLKTCIYAKNIE